MLTHHRDHRVHGEEYLNSLTERAIGCAIQIHRTLGPGLLENAYEACLSYELDKAGLAFEKQKPIPLHYQGVNLDCGYRADLIVENTLLIEIKSIDQIHPIHEAQVITYLKLASLPIGLLINFNSKMLKQGIKRVRI